MKRWLAIGAVLAGSCIAWPAGASGDYGCTPGWQLDLPDRSCSSTIVLSPGNDSRVNLLLLLRDQAGLDGAGPEGAEGEYPETYWYGGEGRNFFDWGTLVRAFYPEDESGAANAYARRWDASRCQSMAAGGEAFATALASARLGGEERELLGEARGQLHPLCEGSGDAAVQWPGGVTSAEGRNFLAYLAGASSFYAGDWPAARLQFASLLRSEDPWLQETSRYMLARIEINAAIDGAFDEWGGFEGTDEADQEAVRAAQRGFDDYLSAYPEGRYAASARGLKRRTWWLGGDMRALAREYERLLGSAAAGERQAAELVDEVDNKLFFPTASGKPVAGAADGPLLLAALDLLRMRGEAYSRDEQVLGSALTRAELDAQAGKFAGREELFTFLQATHAFYVADSPREVLSLVPDDARRTSYTPLQFSRQMLRGMALARLGDRNEEGFWKELLGGAKGLYQRPAAELGLALHYDRRRAIDTVFAADSPVGDVTIREILLEHSAGQALLRRLVREGATPEERSLASYVLLYKELTRGRYADFLTDLPNEPAPPEGFRYSPLGPGRVAAEYPCPALTETVKRLAANASDVKGMLCLGEYYRINGLDWEYFQGPPEGALGSHTSLFPGEAIPRSTFYDKVIADPRAARGDKAYALYRAIRCYEPTGTSSCGGADVPQSRRQGWFRRLKGEFADTNWARDLEYYW
jgi:hypothetical protein